VSVVPGSPGLPTPFSLSFGARGFTRLAGSGGFETVLNPTPITPEQDIVTVNDVTGVFTIDFDRLPQENVYRVTISILVSNIDSKTSPGQGGSIWYTRNGNSFYTGTFAPSEDYSSLSNVVPRSQFSLTTTEQLFFTLDGATNMEAYIPQQNSGFLIVILVNQTN